MTDDYQKIEGVRAPGDFEQAPDDDDPEARVDQLTSEIDETRGDLSQTIEAIGDKLDPGNIAREASETVKDAALGKVEQMTYGAQETWRDVKTGNTGSIVDTITSNPIPAGLVALGVGMLFMNRGQQAQRNDSSSQRGAYGGDTSWQSTQWDRRYAGSGGGESPMDKFGQAAGSAGQKVGEVADSAGQKAGEVLDSVGQTAERLPEQAGYYFEKGGSQVRRFIDENPLGAGVIAMATGAAIGMLLPTTPMEREALGPVRNQVVEKAEGTVHHALDKVEEQMDEAQATPA